MRSIRLLFNSKFVGQYSTGLEDNLSAHEFHTILEIFNQAAETPQITSRMKLTLFVALLLLWSTAVTAVFFLWANLDNIAVLFITVLLVVLNITTLYLLLLQKRKMFERNILTVCDQLNATDNIRGIYFIFLKNGKEVISPAKMSSLSWKPASYIIEIRFDNRYFNLKSSMSKGNHHLSISRPASAHFNRRLF